MELSIQERLKDLRVERGLTLEQLAEQGIRLLDFAHMEEESRTELEKLFQKIRILLSLFDPLQSLGGGHGGDPGRGISQIHLAARHEPGKIIFRFRRQFFPSRLLRFCQDLRVFSRQGMRQGSFRLPDIVICGNG